MHFRSSSITTKLASANGRKCTGAQAAEFAAALTILVMFFVIPLLDLGVIPVRWGLANHLITSYSVNFARAETLSRAFEQLEEDTNLQDLLKKIGGVTAKRLRLALVKAMSNSKPASLTELLNRAQAGDAVAQCTLAFYYIEGRGVEKNPVEAALWYERAAEQENATAQYNLADLYLRGAGVKRDVEKAIRLFSKAAENGDFDAAFCVALIYDRGDGVEQDLERAFQWYNLAAENGSARAQYDLALMYREGRGTAADAERAQHWFSLAAQNGVNLAQKELDS